MSLGTPRIESSTANAEAPDGYEVNSTGAASPRIIEFLFTKMPEQAVNILVAIKTMLTRKSE